MTIYHHFQELCDLTNWNVYGYEALLRHHEVENPEQLFKNARKRNNLYELDTASIKKAIEVFDFNTGHLLFLNVFPSTILNETFSIFIGELVLKNPLIKQKIVFELNESDEEKSIWEKTELKERIIWLKKQGFLIALDDVGKGVASLQKIIEFSPHYIKLDRYFSKELSIHEDKQLMISLLSEYCKDFEIKLVLEGIENPDDLSFAELLNVRIGQGFFIGKPQPVEALMS